MAKKAVGGLVAKLGMKARQAVEAHKNDEVKLQGGGDLPPGIENGIAQLVSCKFGIYEKGDLKGEYYFMASGIVVSPNTITGEDGSKIPVKGLRTQIGPEPIAETPNKSRKTIDDHIAWVMNEMRKLGVDTSELTADDLESTAQALQEMGPHFRFRTWAGEATAQYPNPRTNHDWRGTVEDFDSDSVPEGEDEELVDNTDEAVEEEAAEEAAESEETDWMEVAKAADNDDEDASAMIGEKALEVGIKQSVIDKTPKWTAIAKMILEKLAPAEEPEAEEEAEAEEESVDYDALGASADEGDDEAIASLTESAGTHELNPDDYGTWAELATAIAELEAGGGAEEGGEEEEEAEEAAEEEDVAALGPQADEGDEDAINRLTELAGEAELNPDDYGTWAELAEALATPAEEESEEAAPPTVGDVYHYKPKGAKKPIEVEVKVAGKTTVNLLNLEDKKTIYKSVPFSELING